MAGHLAPSTHGSKIHTSKLGSCNIGAGNPHGKCGYRANCTPPKGFSKWRTPVLWEAHHILPHKAINGYIGDPSESYIDSVYRLTDWCMNQSPNMIGLPMWYHYHSVPSSRGLNLPAHDWDHNVTKGYSYEIRQDFEKRIWSKLRAAQSGGPHFDEKKVLKALKNLEKKWRKELKRRGKRKHRNTLSAWGRRRDPKHTTTWYWPFSMGSDNLLESQKDDPWVY